MYLHSTVLLKHLFRLEIQLKEINANLVQVFFLFLALIFTQAKNPGVN
jgi:hypothetical protein